MWIRILQNALEDNQVLEHVLRWNRYEGEAVATRHVVQPSGLCPSSRPCATSGQPPREILGVHTATSETAAGWLHLLPRPGRPRPHQLGPVGMVTSDAHPGLVDAIGATLPGASWQRCRTHLSLIHI